MASDNNVLAPLGDWSLRARCWKLGLDPNLFFAELVSRECREACATCPVRDECLEYALAERPIGFWGGKTMRERKRILVARGAAGRPVQTLNQTCPSCRETVVPLRWGPQASECPQCGARWPRTAS